MFIDSMLPVFRRSLFVLEVAEDPGAADAESVVRPGECRWWRFTIEEDQDLVDDEYQYCRTNCYRISQ